MRQQGETQASIDRRLAAIEQQLSRPAPKQSRTVVYLLVAVLILVAAVLLVVLIGRI